MVFCGLLSGRKGSDHESLHYQACHIGNYRRYLGESSFWWKVSVDRDMDELSQAEGPGGNVFRVEKDSHVRSVPLRFHSGFQKHFISLYRERNSGRKRVFHQYCGSRDIEVSSCHSLRLRARFMNCGSPGSNPGFSHISQFKRFPEDATPFINLEKPHIIRQLTGVRPATCPCALP